MTPSFSCKGVFNILIPEVALAEFPPNFGNFSKSKIRFLPLNNLFDSKAAVSPARPEPTMTRS